MKVELTNWIKVFDGLELATSSGISEAIDRFNGHFKARSREDFWQEFFKRVSESDALKFLQALVVAEHADQVDIQTALSCLPKDWHQKVSVKKHWGKILRGTAQRLTLDFMNCWSLEYFLEKVPVTEDERQYLRQGISKVYPVILS